MFVFRLFRRQTKRWKWFDGNVSSRSFSSVSNVSNVSNVNGKKKRMRDLYDYLYSKIVACGPITVADYMKEVLTHPTVGYYMNDDVFGKQGDFTTSPEITQLFGEMTAVWMMHEKWRLSRDPFQIIELGPGRGTLMKDILRVLKQFGLSNNVSVHLVEISPALSQIQAKKLCERFDDCDTRCYNYYRKGVTEDGVKLYWYRSVRDVPKDFSIFLAHEFFDALPIHKFQKTERGWMEVLVDITPECKEEKLRFVLSNAPTPATCYISEDERREHVEISPESLVIIDYIADFLWEFGGFALICDYGHVGDKTDTFRGFSRHKVHDPLLRPGTADLTADVDFAAIKKVAERKGRLITFGPVNQSSFLRNLGIDVRLEMLLRNVTEDERITLESGYRMIMDEDKMGTLFKVVSLFPSVLKEYYEKQPLSGF